MPLRSDFSNKEPIAVQNVTDMSMMVANAIDHLTELVNKIQQSKDTAISIDEKSVHAISSSVRELDGERLACHEDLEVETIEASNLRHKLAKFPREIEAEIRGAVASARASNEAEIKSLQERIGSINNVIVETEKKCRLRIVENLSLEPQREKLEIEYEHTIALLNQSLADKASLQIRLNETRKKLKETHEEIEDLEKAMEELGEEMVDEREEARLEKTRLEKAVFETTKQVGDQKEKNITKQKEIEDVEVMTAEYEVKLKERAAKLRLYEQTVAKLDGQGHNLRIHLQKEIGQNASLTKQGMETVKKGTEETQKLTAIANELKRKLAEIREEATKASKEFNRLHAERMKLLNDLDVAKSSGSKGKDEALEVERKLRRIKDDLMHNTRECVRFKQENEDVENISERLKQEHQAAMEILNKQLNDVGTSLNAERKERLDLQNRRDSLNKESSGFRNDYTQVMTQMTTEISDGKEERKRLTERGAQLQKELKSDEVDIKTKQSILQQAKADFISMQKELKGKVGGCEKSIQNLQQQIDECKKNLSIEKPKFEDLQIVFEKKTEEFEAKKKVVVDLKNKKASLETSVDRVQAEIEKIENPLPTLRQQLKDTKSKYFKQLADQTEQIKIKENEIWVVEEKLSRLYDENARFTESITQLEGEHEDLTSRINNIISGRGKIEETISYFKGLIEEKWKQDMKLDKTYYEKDILLLDDITKIQEFTKNREKMIENIYDRLDDELEGLTSFIDRVAGQRPGL